MSEADVTEVLCSEEHEVPPVKRIKLDPIDESLEQCEKESEKEVITPANKTAPEIEFDPLQAIVEAGKKCHEEEIERQRNALEAKGKNNNEDSEDEELESSEDAESESAEEDGNGKTAVTKKRDKSGQVVRKKGKKKKSVHMRKNIKEILKHDQLDDLTIQARKEEEERIRRIQLKQQQLKLLQLQQQQSQLLRESLSAPITDTYPCGNAVSARFTDDLMRRLVQKKHITVSLDKSGMSNQEPTPKMKGDEDDCILLSSDDECDRRPSFASHVQMIGASTEAERKKTIPELCGMSSEVIALSSDEENNDAKCAKKDPRLYEGTVPSGMENRRVEIESDDDCVIISPGPDGEEEEAEEKDECSQDILNVPDEQGRVLVNVGHPDEDPDIFLAPQIAKIVKPHQIGGIRFLYDNTVESKDRYNQTSGFGCILAHAMGLGKTLQTVSFCDVLLRTAGKTVLIIVPINTIQNWLNEFNRYLPSKDSEHTINDCALKKKYLKSKCVNRDDADPYSQNSGDPDKLVPETIEDASKTFSDSVRECAAPDTTPEINNAKNTPPACSSTHNSSPLNYSENITEVQYRNFEVFLLNETVKSLQARERTIRTWKTKGGVLLIGYEMYRMLALKKLKKSTRKAMTLVHEERMAEAESLDRIYECLVDPGPDCVICDEGHRIKNSGAGISQALKAIKTKRRIVLTGYPLQNNLMEYWCMVDFVRPNYLGTKAEFSNMFERPISNGQCADSTYEDKRLMKYRSHVLHSLLEGFVQRRSHVVLRNALPHKEEWVFLVRLTPVQLKIYREFIRYLKEDLESDNASANPIKAFAVCCKIWNHPDVLWNVVKKNLDLELDLDIEEVRPASSTRPIKKKRGTGRPRGRPPLNGLTSSPGSNHDPYDDLMAPLDSESPPVRAETSGISLEWAKPLFENYTPEVMENGVKFELLFELIDETVICGDKLLVFSQSLLTLDLIEVFLKKRLDWRKFREYVRLDGSTAGLEREKLINEFNTSSTLKLFIISTRAGSLGINLVGANRVCIFDASWNPCHDSQAVCRVYRYGQTKPCHIYRFVADCTLEKRIYDRQVNKKGMADRIVDEMNPNTPFKSKDVSSFLVLQHDLLEKLPYIVWSSNLDKFPDPVMKNMLRRIGQKITQEPFEHESLLIDQKHQRLSKSEKRLALKNYEKEKQTVANAYISYSRPSYAQYYSAIGSMSQSGKSLSHAYSGAPNASRYADHGSYTFSKTTASSSSSSVRTLSGGGYSGGGSMDYTAFDRFELHINALKSRGISVFPVQLHQDTFLNDPTGSSDIYVRAGTRIHVLVSQKGTYLRIQGKLLRVPFVGTEMTQAEAERFVMSLLQLPASGESHNKSHKDIYPAEQQLPPSTSMFSLKNASHLQITDSRNNTGGDVMVSSNWTNSAENTGNKTEEHNPPILTSGLSIQQTSTFMNAGFLSANNQQHGISMVNPASSQSDLQSLSRLTETFCQRTSPYSSSDTSNGGKQWCPSPSSSVKCDNAVASPPTDLLEIIKLSRPHSSSNSSNSSNSRTSSPYAIRQPWNNLSSEATSSSSWANKDTSFYTDFTVTPLSRNNGASTTPSSVASPRSSVQQQASPTPTDLLSDFYRPAAALSSIRHASQQHLRDAAFQGFPITNPFIACSPEREEEQTLLESNSTLSTSSQF